MLSGHYHPIRGGGVSQVAGAEAWTVVQVQADSIPFKCVFFLLSVLAVSLQRGALLEQGALMWTLSMCMCGIPARFRNPECS